jgi:hypothetical protein
MFEPKLAYQTSVLDKSDRQARDKSDIFLVSTTDALFCTFTESTRCCSAAEQLEVVFTERLSSSSFIFERCSLIASPATSITLTDATVGRSSATSSLSDSESEEALTCSLT